MKIYGQGIAEAAERFFHGMYVSAAGNQYMDGMIPIGSGTFIWGIIIGIMVIAAMSFVFYMYMRKNNIGIVSHTQPKTM